MNDSDPDSGFKQCLAAMKTQAATKNFNVAPAASLSISCSR